MPHTYEELRAATLDILAGREKVSREPSQYEQLSIGLGELFARREGRTPQSNLGAAEALDAQDKESLLELFWDLFRQGIITLGLDNENREFPFFRLTQYAKQAAAGGNTYFFHDVISYERAIRREVPEIDETTITYLKEAMQAFRSGCLLSATVMLGVAAEHTFMLLLERIYANPNHQATFAKVFNERTLLQKFNKFRNLLEPSIKNLPAEVREDLDIHLSGILSVLRTFRNEAGHPTGRTQEREQTFVLLQLVIPYLKKQYQLMWVYR